MSGVIRTDLAAGFVASVCGKLLKAMSWIQVRAGLLKSDLFNLNPVCRRVNRWSLGREPRVREAEGCCGPSLRNQVQHWQQKTAEVMSFFLWPLVLFYQNIEQPPRLQLGDVTQIAWNKMFQFLELYSCCKYIPRPKQTQSVVGAFTFLGEKLLRVFACQN